MASIYDLKPKFQALLRPLCARLAAMGVTANQVTIGAFVLSAVHSAANFIFTGASPVLFLLPVVLFIRMAMNAIDGMLAREFDQKSKLGAVLNELTDILSDAALYLPFAFIPGVQPALVVFAVLAGVVAETTGVIGVQIGAARRYDGPFGKSDRALFFGVFAMILAVGIAPEGWSDIALGLAGLLGGVTIYNRARNALKEANNGHR